MLSSCNFAWRCFSALNQWKWLAKWMETMPAEKSLVSFNHLIIFHDNHDVVSCFDWMMKQHSNSVSSSKSLKFNNCLAMKTVMDWCTFQNQLIQTIQFQATRSNTSSKALKFYQTSTVKWRHGFLHLPLLNRRVVALLRLMLEHRQWEINVSK